MRPFRARSSITSTILDDLDASDALDVATNVATGWDRPPSDAASWRGARPSGPGPRGTPRQGCTCSRASASSASRMASPNSIHPARSCGAHLVPYDACRRVQSDLNAIRLGELLIDLPLQVPDSSPPHVPTGDSGGPWCPGTPESRRRHREWLPPSPQPCMTRRAEARRDEPRSRPNVHSVGRFADRRRQSRRLPGVAASTLDRRPAGV
jgi:hypothetical protein